jgi:hypothetical protein
MALHDPAPCEHLYAYYDSLWQADHQLGANLLRRGYYQASRGFWAPENNLFTVEKQDMALLNIKSNKLGTITVVNKRKIAAGRDDFYIGRPSVLGNPYTVEEHGRDECIARYNTYLCEAIEQDNPKICAALNQIAQHVLDGYHVRLVCWCAPSPCHGNVIKRIVEDALKEAKL